MDRIALLPPAFLRARLELIDRELGSLPRVSLGKHSGTVVVRTNTYENGSRIKREYSINSHKGQELIRIVERRRELTDAKRLIGQVAGASSVTIDPSTVRTVFNKDMWNRFSSSMMKDYPEGRYEHKGIKMRSRGEVLIAGVLDSLGLEYRYEPTIRIGNTTYCPDFVVYLPEFERCFFIEFFGMMDDISYMTRNSSKVYAYMSAGMVVNRDLLMFSGTMNSMPSVDDMVEDIVGLINKWCRMYSVEGV